MTLVVCTGTATEIGKTWVGAATLRALRDRGLSVAARKPVQSYEIGDPTTDAAELAAATGEAVDMVCPAHRIYEVPMAPPMAADVLGRPSFTIEDLAAEITWPAKAGAMPALVIQHGSGGVSAEREGRYAREMVALGVAAVVIDSFKPRGVTQTVPLAMKMLLLGDGS